MRQRSDFKVDLVQKSGNDESVVWAARVSTGKDTVEFSNAEIGLIGFLMREKHGTPFEHNSMTFRIEAPIFVWREFHRHRIGFSYNEESGRYKKLEPEFYLPNANRPLSQRGKPGAYSFVQSGDMDKWNLVSREFFRMQESAYRAYERMLEADIPREVARMVLPVSIYSTCYVTCNARSLMSFLSLRMADTAMYEIRQIAHMLYAHLQDSFPIVAAAYADNGFIAP